MKHAAKHLHLSILVLLLFAPSRCLSQSGDTVVATNAEWKVDEDQSAKLVTCVHPYWLGANQLQPAQWIWAQPCTASDNETHVFSRAFKVTDAKRTFHLDIAVDNSATVVINGSEAGKVESFSSAVTLDVSRLIHAGSNVIKIKVVNFPGCGSFSCNPAGVMARLVAVSEGSSQKARPKVSGMAQLTAAAVNQDDPKNTEFAELHSDKPVLYGGSKNATSDKLRLTATVQTAPGIKVALYTWSVTGAGADLYKVPPPMPGFNVWNVGSIKPAAGNVTFQCLITFSDGTTATATKTFEIGIRTDDTLVIGWIDATRVPLSTAGVTAHTLTVFPPTGVVPAFFLRDLSAKPRALSTIGALSFYITPGRMLEDADRTYILDWLFKFAPNPPPPPSFADEAALEEFLKDGHNYKLFNRFQIKYRVAVVAPSVAGPGGLKFAANPKILKQQTAIGVTLDPITKWKDFPGEGGPMEGQLRFQPTAPFPQLMSQINEGSPDSGAVKAFNLLAAPFAHHSQMQNAPRWNDIGSMITFGVLFGTQAKIDMQEYPTYYLYTSDDSGVLLKRDNGFVFLQAPDPIDNFTPHHFYGRGYDKVTRGESSSDLKLLLRRSNR